MLRGQTLIDKAAQVCGSRYALAKRLGANQGFLSEVANGHKPIPPTLAARLAAIAGEDPRQEALEALAAQEKDPAKRAALTQLFKLAAVKGSATAAVLLMLLAPSLFPSDVQAQTAATDRPCILCQVIGGNTRLGPMSEVAPTTRYSRRRTRQRPSRNQHVIA